MKREIIEIDRELCNGCGICIPNCHEGALQMIDDKATLVSELMCDGLGACIGHCPQGAISIETREAEPYNEVETLKGMITGGGLNVIIAHLKHLKDYNQTDYVMEAFSYLLENKAEINFDVNALIHTIKSYTKEEIEKPKKVEVKAPKGGCPGSASFTFAPQAAAQTTAAPRTLQSGGGSALAQWPVQMHLINPQAPHFQSSDLLLAADCVAFSVGNFHEEYLAGKRLAIACPKLDSNKEAYVEKLISLIDDAKIDTITVMKMEVPCCGGLLAIAEQALKRASRKIPLKCITVGTRGDIVDSQWLL